MSHSINNKVSSSDLSSQGIWGMFCPCRRKNADTISNRINAFFLGFMGPAPAPIAPPPPSTRTYSTAPIVLLDEEDFDDFLERPTSPSDLMVVRPAFAPTTPLHPVIRLPSHRIMTDEEADHYPTKRPPVAQVAAAPLQKRKPVEPATGVRTALMRDHLREDESDDDLALADVFQEVGTKIYWVISHKTSDFDGPLVSIGGTREREFILFDPESEVLKNVANAFEGILFKNYTKPLTPREFAATLITFMKNDVFPDWDGFLEAVINQAREKEISISQDGHEYIPIDHFITYKTGVCRHHSLVAAYLTYTMLQRFPERFAFTAKVQIMRDNLERRGKVVGAHVWLTLICNGGEKTYSIDTLHNVVGKLEDEKDKRTLQEHYGSKVIENQQRKARALLARLNPPDDY